MPTLINELPACYNDFSCIIFEVANVSMWPALSLMGDDGIFYFAHIIQVKNSLKNFFKCPIQIINVDACLITKSIGL